MGASLTFGLGINANENLRSIINKSIVAETLGFKYLWIADSSVQLYGPVVGSVVAAKTSKIRIGLGLMSVLLHRPSQIAAAVATLYDAYGDRFDLCIGAGDRQQLSAVGIHRERIRDLPVDVLKAKEEIVSCLRDSVVPARVWLGAQGPKMLGIAKSFDGVLLNYSEPRMVEWAIREAALQENRELRIGTYSPSYVYEKLQSGILHLAKVSSAVVAIGASKALLKMFGLYDRLRTARELAKESPTVEAIMYAVPDEVVQNFAITMHAKNLDAYLNKLGRLGVTDVVFAYPQNYSVKTVRELGGALQGYRGDR